MKRLTAGMLAFLLVLSLAACGGGSAEPSDSVPSDGGDVAQEQAEPSEQPQQAEQPSQTDRGSGAICENYEAYSDAKSEFDDYVLDQSHSHEVVSVKLTLATVNELRIFDYILPLSFMGESIKSLGKYDAAFEQLMFKTAYGDDVEIAYDADTGYVVKYTDTNGSKIEVTAEYDGDAHSLGTETYKDGDLALLFEYVKTAGGYAAQYYYQGVIGYDKATPIEGMCTYRILFEGKNGSCARFDNAQAPPESILGATPDAASFIEGATHWFTITDGSFTGNLGGDAF